MNRLQHRFLFYMVGITLFFMWYLTTGAFQYSVYNSASLIYLLITTVGLGVITYIALKSIPGLQLLSVKLVIFVEALCLAFLLLLMELSPFACAIIVAYMLYIFACLPQFIGLASIGFLIGMLVGFQLKPTTINLEVIWQIAPLALLAPFALYLLHNSREVGKGLKNQISFLNDKSLIQIDAISKLSKYMPSQLAHIILTGKALKISNRRKHITVMFSDVVGFTQLSESLDSHDLALFLNTYMEEMCLIAKQYGGTVDKFIGDAMVVFFGDPESLGPEADAQRCAEMAISMRRKINELRVTWQKQGFDGLSVRIGINSGYAHVGNYGHLSRVSYTAIGSEVNLAARLQSESDANEILISASTYTLISNRISCSPREALILKGFEYPINCWQIEDSINNIKGFKRAWYEATVSNFFMQMNMAKMTPKDQKQALDALNEAKRLLEINIKYPSDKV